MGKFGGEIHDKGRLFHTFHSFFHSLPKNADQREVSIFG